ncbi:MAG: DUF805 domain-containing protein [Chlamydiales bacterium]
MGADQPISVDSIGEERYQPKIFSTTGRIGRLRFFLYGIFPRLFALMIFFLIALDRELIEKRAVFNSWFIFFFATLIFSILFMKRRLNDLNKSGWLCLLCLVPVVNVFIGIYMLCFRGNNGVNKYGLPPVVNSFELKITSLLCLVAFFITLFIFIASGAGVEEAGEEQKQIQFEKKIESSNSIYLC